MKSGTGTCIEYLEANLQIATTSIKPDIKALIKNKKCQIYH
jgi:hypothetical protein